MAEILVAVKDRRETGDLAAMPSKLEPLARRIDDITEALKEISLRVGDKLGDLAQTAAREFCIDEIELSLSLDLESGANVIVASGKATAGFEATLRWKRNHV